MAISHKHITTVLTLTNKFYICDDGYLYSLDSPDINRNTGVIFRVIDLVQPEGDYVESRMLRKKHNDTIILLPRNKEIIFQYLWKDMEGL